MKRPASVSLVLILLLGFVFLTPPLLPTHAQGGPIEAPDVTVCQDSVLTDQLFIDAGAACPGTCTMTLDYSGVTASSPGNYPYIVTCGDECANSKQGTVIVASPCEVIAPNFSICQNTTLIDQIFIDAGASCADPCTLSLDYSTVDATTPGDYSYSVNCVEDCGNSAQGTITITPACKATAPNISVCQDSVLTDQIFIDAGAMCSSPCAMTLNYSTVDTSIPGDYSYSVNCAGNCDDLVQGAVTVVATCQATTPNISLCQDTPLTDQLFIDAGVSCSSACTTTLDYSGVDITSPGIYSYSLDCASQCGNSSQGEVTVVPPCTPTAPSFSVCQNTIVTDQTINDAGATCTGGCSISFNYSAVDTATPGDYFYSMDCQGTCITSTQATITVTPASVATAPAISICPNTTLTDQHFIDAGAVCSSSGTMTLNYSAVDTTTPGDYSYSITCTANCGDVKQGTVAVLPDCEPAAPDFSVCQGITLSNQVFTDAGVSCSGTYTMTIDYTAVDITSPGTYSYSVNCDGDCSDSAQGTLTVTALCAPTAPDFTICQNSTLTDQVFTSAGAVCSDSCTATLDYSAVDITSPGTYTYSIDCQGTCSPPAQGTVTVAGKCQATAPTFLVYNGGLLNNQVFIDAGAGCSGTATMTILHAGIDTFQTGNYPYTVKCDCECDSSVSGEVVVTAPYKVLFEHTTGGDVSGNKTQTVSHGYNCSAVTAVAMYGSEFYGWTISSGVGNGTVSDLTKASLTVTNVMGDMTFTAIFTPATTPQQNQSGGGGGGGAAIMPVTTTEPTTNPVTTHIPEPILTTPPGPPTPPEPEITSEETDAVVESPTEIPEYTLTIVVVPEEGGFTTPDPGEYVYEDGSTITVTTTPSVGWEFDVWDGDASGPDPSTTITMDQDKVVIANFREDGGSPTNWPMIAGLSVVGIAMVLTGVLYLLGKIPRESMAFRRR